MLKKSKLPKTAKTIRIFRQINVIEHGRKTKQNKYKKTKNYEGIDELEKSSEI